MFTEKEIKKMKIITTSKWTNFVYIGLAFGMVTLFISSLICFISAQKYAHSINKSVSEIFIEGFCAYKAYSGAYCIAYNLLIRLVRYFFEVIIVLLAILFFRFKVKWSSKILSLIESGNGGKITENNGVKY